MEGRFSRYFYTGRLRALGTPRGCALFCGALLLLAAGGGVLFSIVQSALTSSEPYAEAWGRAEADSRVIEELGQPLEAGWFVRGSLELADEGGAADLVIPFSGPRGRGTLRVLASREGARWSYTRINCELRSGTKTIDLLEPDPAKLRGRLPRGATKMREKP